MERRTIAVNGTVQGVGFRPFVYGLASRLALGGFVKNQAGGVTIEVEGEPAPLDQFLTRLRSDSPPLAHIEQLTWQRQFPMGDKQFRIESSDWSVCGPVAISPDIATCDQCLAEIFDPRDPTISISLHQLHELRTPADHRDRRLTTGNARPWPALRCVPLAARNMKIPPTGDFMPSPPLAPFAAPP